MSPTPKELVAQEHFEHKVRNLPALFGRMPDDAKVILADVDDQLSPDDQIAGLEFKKISVRPGRAEKFSRLDGDRIEPSSKKTTPEDGLTV
jgi:hypothetical protein